VSKQLVREKMRFRRIAFRPSQSHLASGIAPQLTD
jgi:hypothetical protein